MQFDFILLYFTFASSKKFSIYSRSLQSIFSRVDQWNEIDGIIASNKWSSRYVETLLTPVPTTIRNRVSKKMETNRFLHRLLHRFLDFPPTLSRWPHIVRSHPRYPKMLISFFLFLLSLHRFSSKQFSTNMNTNCYIVNFLFSFISFGFIRSIFVCTASGWPNHIRTHYFFCFFSFHWFFVSSFRIEDARAVGRWSTTRREKVLSGNLTKKEL